MNTTTVIATNIARLLEERKVSSVELASSIGVSRQTLFNYLKGNTIIDSVKLVEIAGFFQIDAADLLAEPSSQKPTLLFRTALNYQVAATEIEGEISEYIERYIDLASRAKKNVCFLPEQYNLSVNYDGRLMDVNFECPDYTAPRLKIDPELEAEIKNIADEQRRLLGLKDEGAIALISALSQRGINVVFKELDSSDIFGLSICDASRGSFIFVNTNPEITIERRLFTVAHEYAHILLHRPLYARRMNISKKKNLLDSMADCFAGYLLCPKKLLIDYENTIDDFSANHNLSTLYPIKKKLQISLSSLMMGLKRADYINSNMLSAYYAFLRQNNCDKIELAPISEDAEILKAYHDARDASMVQLLKCTFLNNQLEMDDFDYFLDGQNAPAKEALLETWKTDYSSPAPIVTL